LTQTITLKLPRLHDAQREIKQSAARFNVLCCGRRFGKDVLLKDRLIQPALEGYPVAWFSPSYPTMTEVWRELRGLLQPLTKRTDAQQHRLELVTGGVIDLWSLDAFDSARGRKYRRVVVNEAAMARYLQEAWENVIRPMLADYQGDAWFGSTPKGRNYFWQLWTRGNDGSPESAEWRSWQKPTGANPFIKPEEIEAARVELPELVYQQEYLAEFIEGSGVVFRRIRDCVGDYEKWPVEPYESTFVGGLDWGQKEDFTSLWIIDARTRRVVDHDRFNKIDWAYQRERVKAMHRKWGVSVLVAEANSIGQPNIEALVEDGIDVHPFTTTQSTKTKVIQQLVLAIENNLITLPPDANLMHELEAFTGEMRPDGSMKYGAPEGMHDDDVISLALANWGTL
jgi:hypothetical protein